MVLSNQITELEAEFEKLPAGKPLQTRFLRSQQDLREKLQAEAAAAAAQGGEEEGGEDGGCQFYDGKCWNIKD